MTPIELFLAWYSEAAAAETSDVNAMALATATTEGCPSVRIVLYRGLSGDGLRFFTNQQSRKGGELAGNPRCAAVFYWPVCGRQVRVEGKTERLDDAENDAYFASRPRGHQLAALASRQSQTVERRELDEAFAAVSTRYQGQPVPRPAHWGGYRIVPEAMEFWQTGESRLHHRQLYERSPQGWTVRVLAP